MVLNRLVNGVLVILVVIWGALSVDAGQQWIGLSDTLPQNNENKSVQKSPHSTASPVSSEQRDSEPENTPQLTSSAEVAVRNLFAVLESARTAPPVPVPSPASSAAPVATVTPSPTSSPSPTATPTTAPITMISYKIQGGGVFYEGSLSAEDLSVGEATKRIAADRGFAFKYDATPLGWYVTEIAGVTQNPAQDTYWLYWANGVFGDTSADKKMLKSGDTLVWQYGS